MTLRYTLHRSQDKCIPSPLWVVFAGATALLASLSLPIAAAQPPKAWFEQGEKAFFGSIGRRDLQKAATAYEKACSQRLWHACWRLARLLELPSASSLRLETPTPDRETQIENLDRKACSHGSPESCASLGLRLNSKAGDPAASKQASALFTKACKQKSGQGCYALYLQTQGGRLSEASPKTPLLSEALLYLQRGCRNRFGRDCFLLGYLAYTQKPPILPLSKALSWFRQGCRANDPEACDFAGLLFGNGISTAQDLFQARQHHREACEIGSADGCLHYAGMLQRALGGERDLAQARSLFSNLCSQRDHGQACLLLAEMQLRGEGGDKDIRGALRTYERACRFKHDLGCQRHRSMQRILGSDSER